VKTTRPHATRRVPLAKSPAGNTRRARARTVVTNASEKAVRRLSLDSRLRQAMQAGGRVAWSAK
jgi:hypothetical protein